jgi:cytochrome b561
VQLWAGDIVPIAYPMGWPKLNDLVGIVHSIEFYTIAVLAIAHAGCHIWRHIKLRDNALRIMAPKVFHRYL